MKRFILCVFFVVVSPSVMAAVPMARFSKVIDSRTIVVERIDGTEVVHLTNVNIPAADEQAVRDYLTEKLTGIQHDFHKLILSTMHVHLDHDHCIEVLVVRGKGRDVRTVADSLISTKGVKHGKLTMTTTGKELA